MNARLAACAAALVAAGCATLPPAGGDDWPERRDALQAMDAWTLTGRVAVAAGDQGFSGGLRWRQVGERAEIELRGPLGGRALAILVEDGAMSVTDAEGVTITGEQARHTAAEHVGAPLPMPEMRYWLVGAPAPGSAALETLGADRRLALLAQAGWQIRYTRYGAAAGRALPERMELSADGVRLRLAVSAWRLEP